MANISTIKVGTTSYGIEAAHATSAGCLKNAAGGVGIAGGSASTPVYFNTSGVPTSCTDGIFRSIVYFSTFTDLSSKVTTLRKQFSDSHSAANSNCYIIYPIYTGTATSGYLNLNNPNLGSLTISTYYTHVVLDFQFCERLYTTASINTPIIDVYDVSIQNLNLTVYDTSASTNTDFSKIKVSGGHCNFINNDTL